MSASSSPPPEPPKEPDGFGAILGYVLGFLFILAVLAFAIVWIWRLLS